MLHIEPPPPSAQGGAGGQCGAEPEDDPDALSAAGWDSDSGQCAWDPAESSSSDGADSRQLGANDRVDADGGRVAADAAAAAASAEEQSSDDAASTAGRDSPNPGPDGQQAQQAVAAAAQHQQLSQAAMAAARRDAAAAADEVGAKTGVLAEAAGGAGAGAEGGAGAGTEAEASTQAEQQQQRGQRPMRLELLIPPAAHPWVGERIVGGAGAGPAFMQLAQQVHWNEGLECETLFCSCCTATPLDLRIMPMCRSLLG